MSRTWRSAQMAGTAVARVTDAVASGVTTSETLAVTRKLDLESSLEDDLDFRQFMADLFRHTRIVRYDRDVGKFDVMMDDIVTQITKGIIETSAVSLQWPYGVKLPVEYRNVSLNL